MGEGRSLEANARMDSRSFVAMRFGNGYFMTIPEACQLVLQAGAMGEGGEVFILDMGEPVKIADLARDMVRLSGLEPGEDVAIEFTGMRPGEKLFEELSVGDEAAERTRHPKVFVARCLPQTDAAPLAGLPPDLRAWGDRRVRRWLVDRVPEYAPPDREQLQLEVHEGSGAAAVRGVS